MTAMRRLKANVTATTDVATTTTDVAYVGDRIIRVFGALPCPHCLRGRLRASAMRNIVEHEFAWTCTHCHVDVLQIAAC